MNDDALTDEVIVQRLRAILDAENVKITALAEATGIPYRTLQNQLSGKSRISAVNLLKVLDAANLPSSILTEESATLNVALLAISLQGILGEFLPHIEPGPGGELGVSIPAQRTPKQMAKDAVALAIALEREYGIASVHMSGGFERMLQGPDDGPQ